MTSQPHCVQVLRILSTLTKEILSFLKGSFLSQRYYTGVPSSWKAPPPFQFDTCRSCCSQKPSSLWVLPSSQGATYSCVCGILDYCGVTAQMTGDLHGTVCLMGSCPLDSTSVPCSGQGHAQTHYYFLCTSSVTATTGVLQETRARAADPRIRVAWIPLP